MFLELGADLSLELGAGCLLGGAHFGEDLAVEVVGGDGGESGCGWGGHGGNGVGNKFILLGLLGWGKWMILVILG